MFFYSVFTRIYMTNFTVHAGKFDTGCSIQCHGRRFKGPWSGNLSKFREELNLKSQSMYS